MDFSFEGNYNKSKPTFSFFSEESEIDEEVLSEYSGVNLTRGKTHNKHTNQSRFLQKSKTKVSFLNSCNNCSDSECKSVTKTINLTEIEQQSRYSPLLEKEQAGDLDRGRCSEYQKSGEQNITRKDEINLLLKLLVQEKKRKSQEVMHSYPINISLNTDNECQAIRIQFVSMDDIEPFECSKQTV